MDNEILTTVRASALRRWFGVAVMGILGVMLVYIALVLPPKSFLWQAFLLMFGVAALVLADSTRRATGRVVELTRDGLRDSTGEMIAPLAEIAGLESGTFAMKPSNGFLVRLKTTRSRRWLPGLWWAVGRRVGIGGVTPGSQTKVMAQMLRALIAERDQEDQTN